MYLQRIGILAQTVVNPIWDGLQSYWRLNETSGTSAADSKGSVTGTRTGVACNASGKNSYCGSFTGGTSNINVGTTFNYERTNSFSVSCWYKMSTTTGYLPLFGNTDYSSLYEGYSVFWISGNLYCDIVHYHVNNYIRKYKSGTGLNTNWNYLTVTYNGSSNASGLHIYLNGSEVTGMNTNNSLTLSIIGPNSVFRIGSREGSGFKGLIDEFGIWNRVLSQAEITSLYNSGTGLFY